MTVCAIDPHYLEKAKILGSDEAEIDVSDGFEPSAVKCGKIGENAAIMRISCIADTDFYESLSNRVHMLTIKNAEHEQELLDMASKISKCSQDFSKYFERSCKMKSIYLNVRRRCRRLRTQQARTECKGDIQWRRTSPTSDSM